MPDYSLNSFATKTLVNSIVNNSNEILNIKAFNQKNHKDIILLYTFSYKDIELIVKRALTSNFNLDDCKKDIEKEILFFEEYCNKPDTGNYIFSHGCKRHLYNTEAYELDFQEVGWKTVSLLEESGCSLAHRIIDFNLCCDVREFILNNSSED